MSLLYLWLSTSLSYAVDPRGVLISGFYPQDTGAQRLASEIPEVIKSQLGANPEFKLMLLSEAPDIQGTQATLYSESCPTGNHSGCAMIIAQNADLGYAMTGTLKTTPSGVVASVYFVETSEMREVVSVDIPYSSEEQDIFVVTLERTLVGVLQGRFGVVEDIRETASASEYESAYDEQARLDLNAYSKESGGAQSMGERFDIELERKELTREEIQSWMEEEGSKEWERLDMSAMEYMRYYNSGMDLADWRELAKGKQGALSIRAALGFGYGPSSGAYYGRYARSATDLAVVETYAWQTMEGSSNVQLSGSLGFGLLPGLEVAATGGVFTGRFEIDVHAITVGQFTTAPPSDDFVSSVKFIGGEVIYTPLHTYQVRPLIGLQVTRWNGSMVSDHVVLPEDLPNLPSPNLMMLSTLLGSEIRLGEAIDAFAYVPLSIALSTSRAPEVQHTGSGALTSEHLKKPDDFSKFASGLVLGVRSQFRIFGRNKSKGGLEMYE